MATNFPGSIDVFANPTTLKVDGVDLVRAAHVNDLQDATLAIQNLFITPGTTFVWGATNFPDNKSFKEAILALDGVLTTTSTDLTDHINYVLITDPVQHHANVIQVTAGGNLASTRVQTALEEHQVDIDNIMSGGNVEGVTLDDRYIGKAGAQSMAGPLTIINNLSVEGDTNLGNGIGDTTIVSGDLVVANGFGLTGNLIITGGNIQVDDGQWIGIDQYGGIKFTTEETRLQSKKDLILQIDADDAVDGGPFDGYLRVKNGVDTDVMTIDEAGDMILSVGSASFTADNLIAGVTARIGGTDTLISSGLTVDGAEYHIDLDNDNDETGERFFITKNNDTGAIPSSSDFLFEIDENANMTAGPHLLKPGIQETGYFGLQFKAVAGADFGGVGVNFKTVMTNGPSSITLTPINSINDQNLSVVHSDIYGFFIEFSSVAAGDTRVYGTYTTIGN